MNVTLSQFWQTSKMYLSILIVLLISMFGLSSLYLLHNPRHIALGMTSLITLGAIGLWRWSWFCLQVLRGRIYQHWVFPRWRRSAAVIPLEQLPPVCFLIPTYYEKPWITKQVFRAIAQEAKTLTDPITLLVTSGSDQENTEILEVLRSVDPDLHSIRLIQMVQNGQGKRKAMADGLRTLAQLNLPEDTVVALMDGDSEITPGTLQRCLPFFRLFPKMGALTTDELPLVVGSYWFSEWFHLRQAQRHYHMCSVSLSRKVTCLTGRFSLFRAKAAFDPTFADQLEIDTLNDWLWGNFKFLSGDDKSTWYWLLKRGYDMIYLPDVIIYSIETVSGSRLKRAYQNMRRWYGNMLRNSGRAIALGPQKSGWFLWFVLIDQKISIWIPIITPGLFLLSLLQGKWIGAGIIASWVLMTRPLMLMLFFINFTGRQSYLKPIHLPLLLISQWSACLVKVWTQVNLAQQQWTSRSNQSISAAGTGWRRLVKLGTSQFLYLVSLFCFAITLSWLAGMLNPLQDVSQMWWWQNLTIAQNESIQIIEAIDYGVIPNDDRNDAEALRSLLFHLPPQGTIQINLPLGKIDLFKPITISRSHTILRGEGTGQTILQAHFRQKSQSILQVHPHSNMMNIPSNDLLHTIRLQGFSLRQLSSQPASDLAVNGIFLQQVTQITLENLRFEGSIDQAIVARKTEDMTIEYSVSDNPDADLVKLFQ
jgi:mannuronan synthase